MQKFNSYVVIILIMLSVCGCFSSGSQIPFEDNGDSSGSNGDQPSLPNENSVVTMNTANSANIFSQVESSHYYGYVLLAPSAVQGIIRDQGVEMMEPTMKLSRDFVDLTFSQQ